MATYKCKDCTHETVSSYRPSECDICGSSRFTLIDSIVTLERPMAIDKDIFSSSRFRSTIRGYCEKIGWTITEISDSRAILRFDMESGTVQTLFILRYDNTLEFSCPSGLKFDDTNDFPHWLSTFLMQKNSEFRIGFWCIEKIAGKLVFSLMHNAEITLIDIEYFAKVVIRLTHQCDDFEQAVESMLRSE